MTPRNILLPGLLLCGGLFTWSNALANMLVYPMSADINSSRDEATSVSVYSRTNQIQYVRTRVMHIEHPGTSQEKEVAVGDSEDPGLVVSPEKFALSPGTKKMVRVISTQAPGKEEAWRVYFEAVPGLDDGSQKEAKQTTSVSVNLIWGVLVRVSPAEPQPALTTDEHHLLNAGNIRLFVIRAGNCDTTCHWQNINKSIYPGERFDIPAGIKKNTFRVEYRTGVNTPTTSVDLTAIGE
jgi:P pilus assembly protein, chaperone PapD